MQVDPKISLHKYATLLSFLFSKCGEQFPIIQLVLSVNPSYLDFHGQVEDYRCSLFYFFLGIQICFQRSATWATWAFWVLVDWFLHSPSLR